MNKNYIKYDWLIPGYFIFAFLDFCIGFLGYSAFQKFNLIYLIICTYFVIAKKNKHYSGIDVLIFVLIVSVLIGALLSNTSSALLWAGFRYQIFLMIFFFVGRYYLVNDRFMEIGKYIIICNCILGLYLFITEPSWYISWKMDNVAFDATQGSLYYEMTRLSSLSPYPYWVSYSTFILYVYNFVNLLFYKKNPNLIDYISLTFLFIIMLLCQQRAPIAFSVISTILLIIWSKGNNNKFSYAPILGILLFAGIAILYVFSNMDESQNEFVINKLNSIIEGKNLATERTSDFMQHEDISLFGDGIGKYSHSAIGLGKKSIADQQYLRIMYETGLLGMLMYGLIFILIIIRGLKVRKICAFDFLVALFYMFSMIGANSLSMEGYHTAVFWFCCGRLFNSEYIQYKKSCRIN